MANNSISAANAIGGANAAGNSAAAASNAAGGASNATANASNAAGAASTNAGAGAGGAGGGTAPAWASEFCELYGEILIYAGLAFVLIALLLAAVGAVMALRKEANSSIADRKGITDNVDPVKFIDALKGLVDALAKAPAWFAMFLGGALLLWMAGKLAEDACAPQNNSQREGARTNPKANEQPQGPRPKAGAAPEQPAQPRPAPSSG